MFSLISRRPWAVGLFLAIVAPAGLTPLAAQTVLYDPPAGASSLSSPPSDGLGADLGLPTLLAPTSPSSADLPVAAAPPVAAPSIDETWPLPDLSPENRPLLSPDYGRTEKPFSDLVRAAAADRESQKALPADLPLFASKPAVRSGDRGPNVAALVGRLRAGGFLAAPINPLAPPVLEPSSSTPAQPGVSTSPVPAATPALEDDVATPDVILALRAFQKENHLTVDGVAGAAVAQVINADPIREAVALRVWATAIDQQLSGARAAGARYLVLVNIPSFTLHLLDTQTGDQVLESAVVVGRPNRRTPRFWTSIVNLKISPDWTLPASIGHGRVPPGPSNPLGLVRFSTNNAQDIFLHDTNAHGLFSMSPRAFSHGCVRVQNWAGLAQVLGDMSQDQLSTRLADRRTEYRRVPEKTLVRIIVSRVDLVKGHPVVSPDPYDQGDLAIGTPSLDGQPEPDPADRFSPDPSAAPGPADWGYRAPPASETAVTPLPSSDTVGP